MPQFTVTDPTSGRTATLTGDSPPTEQELTQIFGAGSGAGAAPSAAAEVPAPSPTPGAAPAPTPATPDKLPEFKAGPEIGWWDKVKMEARDALSPIVGESRNQKLQRESNIEALRGISPTLAAYTEQAAPPPTSVVGKATDIALQGGGGVAGQTLGAETGPAAPVMIPLLGAAGGLGGDYISQKRRMMTGESKHLDIGELVQSAITGAIPGGSLAKSGASALALQAAKQGIGGGVGYAARNLIDDEPMSMKNAAWATILPALTGAAGQYAEETAPAVTTARTAAQAKIASKAATLEAGQNLGMVVEPSQVNPSAVNKAVESLAGGPSIRQAATHVNQEVADNVARRVLDPTNPDLDLTSQVARAVRQRAYDTGYRPLANAGQVTTDAQYAQDLQGIIANRQGAARSFPNAVNNDVQNVINSVAVPSFDSGDAIKMVQVLRNSASDAFAQGKNELGIAQRQASQAIEGQIERHLASAAAGGATPQSARAAQELLDNFRDARVLMAQSHDIEDAIREGGGSIVQSSLASKIQAGKPMSGELGDVARFANNNPTVTREGAKTPVPGTTVTGTMARVAGAAGLGGAVGATTHSPEAAALAGAAGILLPSVRGLVRSLVLSKPYQRLMARYPVNVEANPDLGALVIRQGGQAAGAQLSNSPPPAQSSQ